MNVIAAFSMQADFLVCLVRQLCNNVAVIFAYNYTQVAASNLLDANTDKKFYMHKILFHGAITNTVRLRAAAMLYVI